MCTMPVLIVLMVGPALQFIFSSITFSTTVNVIIFLFLLFSFLGTSVNFKIPRILVLKSNKYMSFKNIFILSLIFLIPLIGLFKSIQFSFFGFRQFYISVIENRLGFFFSISIMFSMLLILILVDQKKYAKAILIFPILLLFGKKQVLLDVILLSLLMLEYKKIVNIYKISISLIFTAFFAGTIHFLTYDFGNPFLSVISYFDYYQNLHLLVDKLSTPLFDFKLGEITLSSLYKIIPRFLWESKPIVYGMSIVHQEILPVEFSLGVTPSFFEQIAIPYVDFGFIGVILFGFFNGCISRFSFDLMKKSNFMILSVLFYFYAFSLPYCLFVLTLFIISKISLHKIRQL